MHVSTDDENMRFVEIACVCCIYYKQTCCVTVCAYAYSLYVGVFLQMCVFVLVSVCIHICIWVHNCQRVYRMWIHVCATLCMDVCLCVGLPVAEGC